MGGATGGILGDTGAEAGGYIWGASVVWICRLHLSFASVVGGGKEEKEDGGADVHLNSNNPTLKGGEKPKQAD